MTKPRAMQMLYSFVNGGSERLGALIASDLASGGWPLDVGATDIPDGPVRSWLVSKGISTIGFDRNLGRIGRRWKLYRHLRSRRIEVLHVQHFSMLALCYWPARLARVRRIVVTEHNEEPLRIDDRLWRTSRYYGSRADLVTVIHEGLRRYLVDELGLPPDRVRTIPNGVDTTKFRPAPRDARIRAGLGAGPGDLLVGSVGRLHPFKDQRTLLHAAAQLRRNESAAARLRFVLVGDGQERENLERLCSELGIADMVHFAGDRQDIDRIMPQFDAFVLPSRTEGVPLVLLEAMACGVPCVATSVGGIPELLQDGGGRTVPPGAPEAMASTLASLVRDTGMLRAIGSRGREIATARHDITEMLASYREALLGAGNETPIRPAPRARIRERAGVAQIEGLPQESEPRAPAQADRD